MICSLIFICHRHGWCFSNKLLFLQLLVCRLHKQHWLAVCMCTARRRGQRCRSINENQCRSYGVEAMAHVRRKSTNQPLQWYKTVNFQKHNLHAALPFAFLKHKVDWTVLDLCCQHAYYDHLCLKILHRSQWNGRKENICCVLSVYQTFIQRLLVQNASQMHHKSPHFLKGEPN